jgi:hypothetical protein
MATIYHTMWCHTPEDSTMVTTARTLCVHASASSTDRITTVRTYLMGLYVHASASSTDRITTVRNSYLMGLCVYASASRTDSTHEHNTIGKTQWEQDAD